MGLLKRHHLIWTKALQEHNCRYIGKVNAFAFCGLEVLSLFFRRQDAHHIEVLFAWNSYLGILSFGERVPLYPTLLTTVSKKLTEQEQLLAQGVVMDVVFTPSRFEVLKLGRTDECQWTVRLLEVKLK